MPIQDAWATTLREFCIITRCKDKKAIRDKVEDATKQEILDFFELRALMNG